MTQLLAEKMWLVRRFRDAVLGALGGGGADDEVPENEAAPDPHPLFRPAHAQTVIDADRLHYQATRDLAGHGPHPESDLARLKMVASERMQRDSRERAAQALRKWAAELEGEV